MKKIYLVRHGETYSNADSLVQDGTSTLSEKGLRQALTLSDRIKHLSFDHLLVSDYIRTRQTVAPLLEHISIVPEYTPLVRETKRPTQFVGKSNKSDECRAYLAEANEHIADPAWHFEDEENFHDVVERVKAFFARVAELEGDIVVVTHGRFIIFVMMYVILNGELTPERWLASMYGFATTNTGITVVTYNDIHNRYVLTTYNDHAHFAE